MTLSVFSALADVVSEALGEPVTYTPDGGQQSAIRGVVTIRKEQDPFSEVPVVMEVAQVSLRTIDVPAIAQGDAITLRERSFVVIATYPDGEGMVRVTLEDALV